MKLIYFEQNGAKVLGALGKNEKIIPFDELLDQMHFQSDVGNFVPKNIKEVIKHFSEKQMEVLSQLVKSKDGSISRENVKILAPIEKTDRPIFCLGKNYKEHAKETGGLPGGTDEIPKFPIYFSKMADSAIGHGAIIPSHKMYTDKVDYEVELAVVIGKEGINIPKEKAESHIFGYTILNDISARNLQRKHGQWFKGKNLDGHCIMGPVLVYKSEMPFPIHKKIQCHINDECRQNANTKDLIFDIAEIIHDLSKGMTLKPGDVISTGTPAGVGLGFNPFRFLKSKDRVKCFIEGIGILENTFE